MATPTSPDSFIVSDSRQGDDDGVWAMDLDDDDAGRRYAGRVASGPNVTVGGVCLGPPRRGPPSTARGPWPARTPTWT